ncbi:hypothetical protein DCO58_03585 [Helicobacter saguini]|uniref:Uncharacterized protein n=1 Tax=Helicobacter saguini TaxID=1548018 RepID=A0A347VSD4_9HELI|nr:hypothetical protein [Helicobacter saguini]MWV62552.1 hypothetical protein [Helicobacter saguini]MWV66774.1 hypothetical protein [Helicobacter saguini]MWV69125.1 hypothetical protein [Helicobacter saguini]MWV71320.1 hypothetical protein [Helicobacter saguini]TLD94170.1 hypothetical protein LS64_006605 [Helicobacter saguini]
MVIFSSFTTEQKFKEISDFNECNSVSSDVFIFFRLSDTQSLESYFLLAKKLRDNEIKFAVLLDSNNLGRFNLLKTSLLMFADLGASYFMIERDDGDFIKGRHDDMLATLQNIANFYLLDMKILAVVSSYQAIEELSFMRMPNDSMDDSDTHIGIDGIIERKVLYGGNN